MEERIIENNKVTIKGEVISDFTYSHELYGEKFYKSELMAMRMSGTADIIPIMASERLIDVNSDWKHRYIRINGQFRSYNKREEDKNRLILLVFVKEFEEIELPFATENRIFLDGYICKETIYRETPLGREVTDAIIAVNRPYGKSDYIPCVAWGRNARFTDKLEIGTRIQIEGRIQSREYQKMIGEDEYETRTAYEVSVSKINVIEETEANEHEKEN